MSGHVGGRERERAWPLRAVGGSDGVVATTTGAWDFRCHFDRSSRTSCTRVLVQARRVPPDGPRALDAAAARPPVRALCDGWLTIGPQDPPTV